MAVESGPVESIKDFGGTDQQAVVRRWQTELELADKELRDWHKRCDKIRRRYRDDRKDYEVSWDRERRFNILWSNVQTQLPVYYSREPLPVVERRFSDEDPIARTAGMILERTLITEHALSDFGYQMRNCVFDFLLDARGVPWVRYTFEKGQVPVEGAPGQFVEDITRQNVPAMHIHRQDFLYSPARSWDEVRWVARRFFLTRDELKAEYGDELGKEIPLDYEPKHTQENTTQRSTPEYEAFKKASIWEIWDKPSGQVVFISRSYGERPLKVQPAPLKLRNFFPCPRPAFGTLTTDSLVPIPDYDEYRDQAEQLDELTARIALLTRALRLAGVYAGEHKAELDRLVQADTDNILIPVDQWAMLSEKGGLKGVIEFLPIKEIAEVLTALLDIRERVKKDLWEITGLSDLFRGQTVASETATAQRLKGQFASLRVKDRQDEIKRMIRDTVRIQAEIASEMFIPRVLLDMSGIEGAQGADMQAIQPALDLLRNDDFRSWKIEVETDDAPMRDPDMEKQSAVEFITAFGGLLERAIPLAQQAPPLLPFIGEMLKYAMRKFSTARALEASFEQAMPALQQQAEAAKQLQDQAQQQAVEMQGMQEPGEAPGNPQAEMAEVMIESQKAKQEMAHDRERMGMEKESHKMDMAMDAQKLKMQAQQGQMKQRLEVMKAMGAQAKQAADIRNNQAKTQLQAMRPQQGAMPGAAPGGRGPI